MTFWILAAVVCVVLFALLWWTSGWAAPRFRVDREAAIRDAEAAARTETTGFHPNGPAAGF